MKSLKISSLAILLIIANVSILFSQNQNWVGLYTITPPKTFSGKILFKKVPPCYYLLLNMDSTYQEYFTGELNNFFSNGIIRFSNDTLLLIDKLNDTIPNSIYINESFENNASKTILIKPVKDSYNNHYYPITLIINDTNKFIIEDLNEKCEISNFQGDIRSIQLKGFRISNLQSIKFSKYFVTNFKNNRFEIELPETTQCTYYFLGKRSFVFKSRNTILEFATKLKLHRNKKYKSKIPCISEN